MRAHEFVAEGRSEDPDLVIQVMSMWDAGMRQMDIAKELNLKPKRVDTILNNYYRDRPNKKLDLGKLSTPEERQQMALDFIGGDNLDAIANRNGVSSNFVLRTVISILGKEDYDAIQKQRHGAIGIKRGKTPEEIQAMAAEYAAGKSYPAIGKKYGVNASTVHYHVHRQPNSADIIKQHMDNLPKPVVNTPSTTTIYRPGTMDNRRNRGPSSRQMARKL